MRQGAMSETLAQMVKVDSTFQPYILCLVQMCDYLSPLWFCTTLQWKNVNELNKNYLWLSQSP